MQDAVIDFDWDSAEVHTRREAAELCWTELREKVTLELFCMTGGNEAGMRRE